MSEFDHIEIFKGKSFSGLFKDIYENSKDKEKQIKILIAELRPLVKTIGDATIIVPLIKEYLDIGVKNDEQLVKLAAIVQRATKTTGDDSSGGFALTPEEKEQLLKKADEVADEFGKSDEKFVDLLEKTDSLKKED